MKNKKPKYSAIHLDVIKELFYIKSATSAELSLRLDKSIPSINKVIADLIEDGYVAEKGLAPSSGGRRPLMYALVENKSYIIVIAMDQLSTRIGLVDLQNNEAYTAVSLEIDLIHDDEALAKLISAIENYISDSKIAKSKIMGIGIGMPGFVDAKKGINFTYLKPQEKSLANYLSEEIGIPTFIDNDSSLVALAEHKLGNAAQQKEVMVINLGWGIGLGMIVKGELYRGYNGFAGEFSHIPITEKEILCSCGKQGCLEAVASLLAVTNKAISGLEAGKLSSLRNPKHYHSKIDMSNAILAKANQGDQFSIKLISESAYDIGRALSILIHIMNPQTIILSGRMVRAGRIMLAPIQQALNKYCIPRLFAGTEIKLSNLGFDAELIGASILVIENLEHLI
ncbi:ROK family protein [Pedobacter frigidisoli]|uniref:ROK family protein n=1 Tax=Pedobacter frigidisoli TaxID=2530455 RepID=UPI0029310A88|nr:ROK family protein [Pedobacter frigidisoli]